MNISFADKTVLVAGGSGGLGRAVSLAFLGEGATVIVPYRRETSSPNCRPLPARSPLRSTATRST